jgi:MFS family permease
MGAILASNGIGGAIAMQIVSPVIASSETGYKNAYLLIAATLTFLFVLLVIFFKDRPKNQEVISREAPKGKKSRGQEWVGIEFKQLAKKWWFYLALVCVFFTGFVLQGITGISAAHMGDVGITQAFIATVLSVHSISLACFKFLTGFMYDKFGLRVTMSVCSFTAILVMLLLAFISNSTIGMIFAMAYGILSSLALPLETIMLPIYASDLFGQKSYGKVLGIVVATNVAGYALGTPIVNLVYSLTSSYNIALFGGAILMALVIIGMNVVIKQAKKERMIIESEQFKAEENYGNN